MLLNKNDLEQYRHAVQELKVEIDKHQEKSFSHGLQYGSLTNTTNKPSLSDPDRPPNNKFRSF